MFEDKQMKLHATLIHKTKQNKKEQNKITL